MRHSFHLPVNIVLSNGVTSYKMADFVGTDYDSTATQLRNKGFTVNKVVGSGPFFCIIKNVLSLH